jgi:hypothetical protein
MNTPFYKPYLLVYVSGKGLKTKEKRQGIYLAS